MKTMIILSLLVFCAPAAATPPNVLNFSGHLAGAAGALSGDATLTLALYDDPDSFASAHVLWTETSTVFVAEGRFHVLLGADPSNPLPAAAFASATVYVGVRVGSDDELRPRLRVASVPFSLRAEQADRLGGLAPEAFSPSGHTHSFDAVQGQVAESQLPASVVLADQLAAGLATKAGQEHAHDAVYVNEGEANAIGGAMVLDGSLLLGDLGDSGCADGQVAKWSEGALAWICSADDDTIVSAGTGVLLEGGVLRLDQATVAGWAAAACFDTPSELADVLDVRYASVDHLHDTRYPSSSAVDAALAGKADAGHLHDDRYPLAVDVTAALAGKAPAVHDHDPRYYTKSEADARLESSTTTLQTALAGKADAGHLHDGRYPLATDVTTSLAGKAALVHGHDAAYVNEGQVAAVTTAMLADGSVSLQKLADAGCAQGQVVSWDDVAGAWTCADDRVGQYSGADFALSNQGCAFGQLVGGVDASGRVTCVDDVVYGAGTGLVLVGGALNVDRGTIEGWAQGTCYDTPAELASALDARYAALGHTHASYATFADMNGALSTKADLFHDHAELYYLKDEADVRYVNEAQADAVTGAMIADGSLTLADLGASTCANGQIAKRVPGTDGVTYVWGCSPDNDTQYSAGTGLSLVTGRFDVVQGTIESWARGVAYDTPLELKNAVPAWDQLASDDLTTATAFQGQVTGAYNALALGNDVVTSANLVNGTIQASDLGLGAVTGAAILDGTIGTVDLADAVVGSAQIANGSIAAADLAANSITSAAILDASIAPSDLAIGSVTTGAILDGTIVAADLGVGSVTSTGILNGTVAAADLASGSVTTAAIADGTIATSDVATGAITSAHILNYTIAAADLADGCVSSNALAVDSVTVTALAADSVTTGAILDGTVTTADLANGAVTSAILAVGAVTTADLAADSVSSTHIVNGTIVAVDLANQAVTSAIIANNTIVAADVADGTLTNTQISATAAIAPSKIAGTAWTSINDGAASTLDADLLDGLSSSSFATATHAHGTADITDGTLVNADISATAAIAPSKIAGTAWTSINDGAASTLDADLLDGLSSSSFATAAHNHDGVYWKSNSDSLRLATTALAPACAAANLGEVRLTSKYNLCVCGLFGATTYAWRLPDGATACAW